MPITTAKPSLRTHALEQEVSGRRQHQVEEAMTPAVDVGVGFPEQSTDEVRGHDAEIVPPITAVEQNPVGVHEDARNSLVGVSNASGHSLHVLPDQSANRN